jgi:CheY-like chemotaxis protein
MKNILLVDDDPVVLRVFQEGLMRQGFQVQTAIDGLAAINSLDASRPDVVVLDLMMPKLSGADVVRFIRGQAALADLPVIVLSNSYVDELLNAARQAGVQETLVKSRCTPSTLVEIIEQTLGLNSPAKSQPSVADQEFRARARRDFLAHAKQTCQALRELCNKLKLGSTDLEKERRLQDLYRKAHFVTATAGLANCSRIEKMSTVLEALLVSFTQKPINLDASVWRTLNMSIDFLETLFQESDEAAPPPQTNPRVLVVDDDAVTNRAIISTLRRINLTAYGFQDPVEAFLSLQTVRYDLMLLDIEMPGVSGIELCRRVRGLGPYRKTPIVFVTLHADFETHAEGLLSGGNDLIAKPIFPMELAVKTVIHLLKKESEEV